MTTDLHDENGKLLKDQTNKLGLRYISPGFMEGVAFVLDYGAGKYSPLGYLSPTLKCSEHVEAAMRHLHKLRKGEELDDESGEHHIFHVGANMAMIAAKLGTQADDLRLGWPYKGED